MSKIIEVYSKGERYEVIVDDDFDKRKIWICNKYLRVYDQGKEVALHRFIMKPNKGEVIYFINGNRFDCRRKNLKITKNSENEIIETFTDKRIITYKKGEPIEVIVDKDFVPPSKLLNRGGGYFSVKHNGKWIALHRYITNAKDNQVVDHINRLKNDNRRSNLRVCDSTSNNRNRVAKGYQTTPGGKYRAHIQVNKKQMHIGCYDTKEEAKQAYIREHVKHFKEFSPYFKEVN